MSASLDRFHLVGGLVADRYRIDEVIAETPLSLEYRGADDSSGRAIKLTVLKVLGEFTSSERRAILDELVTACSVVRPLASADAAITAPREAGALTLRDGNWVPYLAQSYFAGASLEQIRGEELGFGLPPRTLAQAMQLLGPAARALGLAASRDVVHGGLTPSCIALLGDPRSPDPQLRIFDWGIARAIQAAHGHGGAVARVTPSFFNPRFAAPEQIDGTGEPVGPATDVFSFALVMAYMLAYAPSDPQRAKDPSHYRAPPGRRGAALPAGADAIFARALAREPSRRPATVAAFWQALVEIRGPASVALSSIPPPPRAAPALGRERPPPAARAPQLSDALPTDRLVRLPSTARPDDKTLQISALNIRKPAKRRAAGSRARLLFLLVLLLGLLAVASFFLEREFGLTSRLRGLFSASP